MKHALVVGLGIGELYCSVLGRLNFHVETLDLNPAKNPTYTSMNDIHKKYDISIICTPNYTHESIARSLANKSDIILIEKPGVKDRESWKSLVEDFPSVRIMMIKNNMWRHNIPDMLKLAKKSDVVTLNWINKDRVPNPGTWFTTKELAYGGVSRDLMPHLLSLYMALHPEYIPSNCSISSKRRYMLSDLTQTDYGMVDKNGTYDVDDYCQVQLEKWTLTADWRNTEYDRRNIDFYIDNQVVETVELGLCPEEAYESMIKDVMLNKKNQDFWDHQKVVDLWIHDILEAV